MAEGYEIIQEDGYLRIVISEEVTVSDYVRAYQDVAESHRSRPQPRLWILPAHVSGFMLGDLEAIASAGEKHAVDGKAATVAPSDYMYGLTRQATLLRRDAGDRFGVFRTETEALAWLRA